MTKGEQKVYSVTGHEQKVYVRCAKKDCGARVEQSLAFEYGWFQVRVAGRYGDVTYVACKPSHVIALFVRTVSEVGAKAANVVEYGS